MIIREYKNFKYGIIDSLEARSVPEGAASAALNWLTAGDKIELRRGMLRLGTENTGTGRISGLHVGFKSDGTEVLFKTYARKIKYYDTVTSDWIEIGTNQLPAAANAEDVSFANYQTNAGAQMFLSSPNSNLYKIMTANPGSITELYAAATNFKGYIKIKQNRMFLWNRRGGSGAVANQRDITGLYGSYIDVQAFTTVTAEATTSLSGTLAFKAAGALRTCFGVTITITASSEIYTDNYDGTLSGSAGGTGTINYTTGDYTLSAAGVGTADYQWENSNNTGITDFTKSATRVAGQGFIFRQDDGGAIQFVGSFGDAEYCLHEKKTWVLTLTSTDTAATNLIFRQKVGIPNWRASVETGDGIYYIDDTDETDPTIRILSLDASSSEVIPVPKSLNLNLADYRFNEAAMIEYGDYVLIACRHKDSDDNNKVLIYNKVWNSWDIADWWVSSFVVYNGVLMVGDSISNNVYELFSGLDDDNSLITNSWEGWLSDLELEGLKKSKKLVVQGAIGPDQDIEVYVDIDNGGYTLVGTINGDGAYVDAGTSVNVGAVTIGRTEVGGGGLSGAIPAYNYMKQFSLTQGKFERIKVKFVATGIGYASVSTLRFMDVRSKGKKIPSKYR